MEWIEWYDKERRMWLRMTIYLPDSICINGNNNVRLENEAIV